MDENTWRDIMQRMVREIQHKDVIIVVLCSFYIGTIKTCPPGHFQSIGIDARSMRASLRKLIVITLPPLNVR